MFRGYYTASSGIVTQEKKLNIYANNLSNSNTSGYKKDDVVSGTFGEHLAVRMDKYQGSAANEIGRGIFMQTITAEYTDYTQGGLEETGRPMDMALLGDGYFVVTDDEGNEYLTRDGQFSLDEEGYLVLPGIGRVQGENGDILIGTSDFDVFADGRIYLHPAYGEEEEEGVDLDRLLLVIPGEDAVMKKALNGLFSTDDYGPAGAGAVPRVAQKHVERSNVNVAQEMSRVIASQRGLQSCSQIVKMYDELSDQSNTRIARVQ